MGNPNINFFWFMIRAKIKLSHGKLYGKPSRGKDNARFIFHEKDHPVAFW